MIDKLTQLLAGTEQALLEAEEVADGTHFNDQVGRGVPLPKHLHAQGIEALKLAYGAEFAALLGKTDASMQHHAASAAYYNFHHSLKEAGFTRFGAKMLKRSHNHRKAAVGQ